MKVTTDIASFLKRNGTKLTLSYDEKSNTFLAWTPGEECASKYLDDALENLQEALRRRANNMQPVRETASETRPAPKPVASGGGGYVTFTINGIPLKTMGTTPAPPMPMLSNGPLVAASCGTMTPRGGTCPQCNKLPGNVPNGLWAACPDGHSWTLPGPGQYAIYNPTCWIKPEVHELSPNGAWSLIMVMP